jgi:putative ubiquitin-RnfH superfamily antitoxin RatB of RatAB toxin-antitoxin module
MAMPDALRSVEIVYALAHEQVLVSIELQPGMTALQALERSLLMDRFPEIRARALVLGLFGTEIPPDHVLVDGDRVEVCRALLADPREMRRNRLR